MTRKHLENTVMSFFRIKYEYKRPISSFFLSKFILLDFVMLAHT